MSIVEDPRRALGPVGVYLPVSFTSMSSAMPRYASSRWAT
jgi:hypothetical protein